MLIQTLVSGGMDVVCVLICTLVSGDIDGCMYWYLEVWTVVYMLICTLVSGDKDGCIYVNMYIGIWWYGWLYVC